MSQSLAQAGLFAFGGFEIERIQGRRGQIGIERYRVCHLPFCSFDPVLF